MIAINALATRAGGAAVRVNQVAARAPALWGTRVLLLRNQGAGIGVAANPGLALGGWPRLLAHAPALPRRIAEAAVVRRSIRGLPVRALLHYGTYVPLRAPAGVLSVLCFVSLAPWDPGPASRSARNRMLRSLFERTRSRADLIVVQSAATRDFLARHYRDLSARLAVVVNGLSVPALRRHSAPRGFLLLGDVHGYRRADQVVRAYAALDPELRAAHPLTIAGHTGRDGAAARRLDAVLRATGLVEEVRRPGLIPRQLALELMAGAAAFISFATVENGPNALREARAAGTPLILTDIPVHREFGGDATFVHDVGGLTVAMRAAAAAAGQYTSESTRAAVDTWDEHVAALGDLLRQHGALP